uniref:Uncharacterized protein n=1 Tax=Anopheles darlingi TaxID=43151 RepID=A0A2M4D1B1_ANODA
MHVVFSVCLCANALCVALYLLCFPYNLSFHCPISLLVLIYSSTQSSTLCIHSMSPLIFLMNGATGRKSTYYSLC